MITVTLYDKVTGDFVESRTVPSIQDYHLNVDPNKYKVVEGDHAPPDPEPDVEHENRLKRNRLLSGSDWTVGRDSPLNESKIQEWVDYRKKLRDITDWMNPEWPVAPK